MDTTSRSTTESAAEIRKIWEEPRVVLERLLLVSAQEGGKDYSSAPSFPGQPSFMGPLDASGGLICD